MFCDKYVQHGQLKLGYHNLIFLSFYFIRLCEISFKTCPYHQEQEHLVQKSFLIVQVSLQKSKLSGYESGISMANLLHRHVLAEPTERSAVSVPGPDRTPASLWPPGALRRQALREEPPTGRKEVLIPESMASHLPKSA